MPDLVTIVGPNGAGKTNLIRAIEVVGKHMKQYEILPEAYYHNRNTGCPVEIEIDVELSDYESGIVSDFLVCACISRSGLGDIPYAARENQILRSIMQDNGDRHFGDLCRTLTLNMRAVRRLASPEIHFQISKGGERLRIRYNTVTKTGMGTQSAMLSKLVLDRARLEVPGLDDYLSESREDLPSLDGFVADLFGIMNERNGDASCKLGEVHPNEFDQMGEIPQEFRHVWDFMGNSDGDSISFDNVITRMFVKSTVKISDMLTRPSEAPIPGHAQEVDMENITHQNLVQILFVMSNSDDSAMVSRYENIISQMRDRTGLEVRIQTKARKSREKRLGEQRPVGPAQNQRDHRPDHTIAVGFMKDGIPIPSELMASGYVELLALLTALIGQEDKVLLLDEPASRLHPDRQREVHNIIRDIAKEGRNQIILVTHSPFIMDPYGRGSLWRIAGKTETKALNVEELLRTDEKTGRNMHNVDVRSALFQEGVVIVEGPSDRMVIEHADRFMMENGGGPDITGNAWAVLDAGGKKSVGQLSRLAEKLEMCHVSVVDRDALMQCNKTATIEDEDVKTSLVIKHIWDTDGLEKGERKIVKEARCHAVADSCSEYDSECFESLRRIAKSHKIYVQDLDLEDVIGAEKKGGRTSKLQIAEEYISQMYSTGRVPEKLKDMMDWIGKMIKEVSVR